jgi:predicted transcriptional regulator
MQASYPIDLEAILHAISKEEQLDLIKLIANERYEANTALTPFAIRKILNITKRELDTSLEKLITLSLVDMVGEGYSLTKLGKDVYEVLTVIEVATNFSSKLNGIETQNLPNSLDDHELNGLVERLLIKANLKQISKRNIPNDGREKVNSGITDIE